MSNSSNRRPRVALLALAALLVLGLGGWAGYRWWSHKQLVKAAKAAPKGTLVELFTSEGCNSCPPADEAFGKLVGMPGNRLVGLSFHVDYFDSPAYRDPFALSEGNLRQGLYARHLPGGGTNTPQVVVHGGRAGVGTDAACIAKGLEGGGVKQGQWLATHPPILEAGSEGEWTLSARFEPVKGSPARSHIAQLYWVSPRLESKVTGGENKGKELVHHNVVRKVLRVAHRPPSAGCTVRTTLGAGPKDPSMKAALTLADERSGRVAWAGWVPSGKPPHLAKTLGLPSLPERSHGRDACMKAYQYRGLVVLALLASLGATGCCKRTRSDGADDDVSANDDHDTGSEAPSGGRRWTGLRAGRLRIGGKVRAPYSNRNKLYPGKIREFYGKLARIDFDDGDKGWAKITSLRPAGTPLARPPKRSLRFRVGSKVRCPFSNHSDRYPGRVTEVYGKLVHIQFNDGDRGWAKASRCRRK